MAGLNPHAGEAGLFGSEEQESIMPAVLAAREYDGYLAEFAPTDYGVVDIDEATESKLTVKNRLKVAAARRGWELHFLRTAGPELRFEVRDQDQPVANTGTETIEVQAERAEGTLDDEPARDVVRRARRKGGAAGE